MVEQKDKFPRGVEIVGSAIIQNSNGEILLTRSPRWNNKWIMPGGHIEPGESILLAITREAQEEANLELEPVEVIHWGELINSKDYHRPAHFVFFDVYCKVIGGNLKLDNDELTEYQWVPPQEALQMDLAESYDDTIKKFIEYLKKK